ncbi:MrcB family domain-containing protein [Paenibacillus sp. WLX1005]|uniref:MrcB family domain-containing protein n=1 Tax=Paenibacillus sp. WLX1005 TaxID=3243766 RepID=UPI0039841AC7
MTLPIELQNIFLHRQKSYKMVLILVLIDEMRATREREVSMTRIKERFLEYFQKREARSMPVDAPPSRIAFRWADMPVKRVQYVVDTPIDALSSILDYPSSGYTIGFKPELYSQLNPAVLDELYHYTLDELDTYYAPPQSDFSLREDLLNIIGNYLLAKQQPLTGHPLAKYVRKEIPQHLRSLPFVHNHFKVQGSVGSGSNWATIPWIAVMYPQLTDTIQRGVYVAYLFSADMKRLYLTLNQGLNEVRSHLGRSESQTYLQERARVIREKLPAGRMKLSDDIDLGDGRLGDDYQTSTIAYFAYDTERLPDNEQLVTDLWDAMDSYMFYIESTAITLNTVWTTQVQEDDGGDVYTPRLRDRDVSGVLEQVHEHIAGNGFYFPEQLTYNFYLSLKTRPFVILAGISGTGKTRLVRLFAEAVGATAENGQFTLIPVRPDWSDPAELIGYRDLSGMFQPGPLTLVIREASRPENRKKPYFVCLDEMNLARVEHYFSDMMSLLETQKWRQESEHLYSSPERWQEYVYSDGQEHAYSDGSEYMQKHKDGNVDAGGRSYPGRTDYGVDATVHTDADTKRSERVQPEPVNGQNAAERSDLTAGKHGHVADDEYRLVDGHDDHWDGAESRSRSDWENKSPTRMNKDGSGYPGNMEEETEQDSIHMRSRSANTTSGHNGVSHSSKISNSDRIPNNNTISNISRAPSGRASNSEGPFGNSNSANGNNVDSVWQQQSSATKGERRIVTDPLIAAGMLQLEEDRVMYGHLGIPDNVYIVGTVNMDETTYPFSKRVLDRANTIEFHHIDLMQLPDDAADHAQSVEVVPVEQGFLRSDYLQLKDAIGEYRELVVRTTERLVQVNAVLESIHAHVGYRIRDAVCFYAVYNERFGLMSEEEAFDLQLLQKILPRIQGSQMAVRRALVRLLEWCLKGNVRVPSPLEDDENFWDSWETGNTPPEADYPDSARKLVYMIRRLDEDGFTSYWVH